MHRFRVLDALGVGGSGRVDLVEDRLRPGSRVAMKELLGRDIAQADALGREFATLATLRHPSLVEVFEMFVDSETRRTRFTMEYVEGDDIVSALRREGPGSFVSLMAETLRALAFLHQFGLVHRDLKPGNILVRRQPRAGHRIVVLDFGLAVPRTVDPDVASPPLAGTLPYIAPELLDGAAPTKRSDLYALGALAFEAIHGRVPFAMKGNDLAAFVAAVREGRRSRPKLPEGFPARTAHWLDELLAPDPADRPTSAIDALARLNEAFGAAEPLEPSNDRAARLRSGLPVGRDAELAALRAALAPSDLPRVVWLCGDAGSGKTRLMRFLAAESVGSGRRVFAPPGRLPDHPDDFAARVRADAGTLPTLVLLDEVERADDATVRFLERIAREPGEAPVRVVAALRSGEVTGTRLKALVADTGVVPSLARVELAPLDEQGLKAMIERATAGLASAQARVRWLLDASEGNAGAAEAILVEGAWDKTTRRPVAAVLEASIRRRMSGLSADARRWLEALSVLGEDVSEALVAILSGLDERSEAAAAETLAAGLARRTGGSVSPDSRRVVDAATSAADGDRLRQLHARAGAHYGALPRDPAGEIAWRLARLTRGAGELDRSYAAAREAASAAETAKDWGAAAERFRFALTLLPRRDRRFRELWMSLGDALRRQMAHLPAAKAYGWAARHAEADDGREMAEARRARALLSAGRLAAASRAAQRIVEKNLDAREPAAAALALIVATHAAMQRYEFREASASAGRAIAMPGDVPPDVRAEALLVAAAAGSRLDDPRVDGWFAEAEHLARANELTDLLMLVLLTRATVEERRSQPDKLEATLAVTTALAAKERRPEALLRSLYQTARLHALTGRFDRAVAGALAAEQLARFNQPPSAVNAAIFAAESLLDAGRSAEAIPLLAPFVEHPLQGTPEAWVLFPRLVLARALLESGSPSAAEIRKLLDGVLAAFRSKGPLLHADALDHELIWRTTLGCPDPLKPILEEADALLAREGAALPESGRVSLSLHVALAHAASGQFVEVVDRLRELVPSAGVPVVPHLFSRAQFALADALTALGRSEDAYACLQRGHELMRQAAERIADPDWRRDFLDQPAVRKLLAKVPKPPDAKRIEALYEMIRALNSETDPEALLESILRLAMEAVGAERGMVLLSGPSGSDFSVRVSRNLERETQADAEAFSRRIVAQAELGQSVLTLDAGLDDRFKAFKSVGLFRIRSLMCVPMRSRGRIVGTVYLDSRRQGKPFTPDDLRFVEAFADHAALALENAKRRAELEFENRRLKAVVGERASYGKIVGRAPAMQKVFDLLERIASSDVTVLIQGESGTGKELVARALHYNGPRSEKAFVSENCASMPETLLESELFGHVKGAFTGADRDRAGLFEHAHQGTLFLDEVGDMSAAMQARLLRVLQEGELRRVGGDQTIRVDVRLIAATNKDLLGEIAAGRFREDLYYRLAVVPVRMPPLRERVGDVTLLVGHLLEQIAAARGRATPRIDAEVLDALEIYPWPGNIRQLENLLRRVSLLAGDAAITRDVVESDADLARMLFGKPAAAGPVLSMVKTEEEQIRRALEAAAGNRDRAARLLGISRATIYRKMREFSLR